MITTDRPSSYDVFPSAQLLLQQGQVTAAMAALSLGLRRMGAAAVTGDVQDRLLGCSAAAATFAHEWSKLTGAREDRLDVVLAMGFPSPAWVLCPDCGGHFCRLHLLHVGECSCPPFSEWRLNPYVDGGPEV